MCGECSTSPVTRGSSPHPFMPDLEIDVSPLPNLRPVIQARRNPMSRSRPAKMLAGKAGQRRTAKYDGFGTKKESSSCQASPQRTAGCDGCGKEGYKPGPAFAPLPPLVYNRSVFWNRVDGVSTWPHHDISLLVPRH